MINRMEWTMKDEGNVLNAGCDVEAVELISMAEHVTRWQGSGMSKRQYAQTHALNYWAIRRACRRYAPESVRRIDTKTLAEPALAPAMIELALRPREEDTLEMVLANGVRMHLRGAHAHSVMERLLSTLS